MSLPDKKSIVQRSKMGLFRLELDYLRVILMKLYCFKKMSF
jgi:hypothetical protein